MSEMAHSVEENLALALCLAREVDRKGGRAYYVGGYVRDKRMAEVSGESDMAERAVAGIRQVDSERAESIQAKDHESSGHIDIDLEIYGILPEQLTEILSQFGNIVETGISYGVYGIEGYDLDIALPRLERAIGKGHKDFQVTVDPFLSSRRAVERRDFTMNALLQDVLTGEIIDHKNGLLDMRDRKIRHVCEESFPEDPLRLFRAARFAARFDYEIAEETIALCREMDVRVLAKERVFGELKKALLQSRKPSIFFRELRKMGQLSYWFPEVEAMIGVQQGRKYHKEGDVWTHTMLALDQAAACRSQVRQPLSFLLAALCHDMGKPAVTTFQKGDWHAYQHELAGVEIAEGFVRRLSGEKQILAYVSNMVRLHMRPHTICFSDSSIKKSNHMFDESVEPYDLIMLAACDEKAAWKDLPHFDEEAYLVKRLAIYEEYMTRPYVMGKDLLEAGLKPGKEFSEILAHAHKLRLAGIPKETALKQTLAFAKRLPLESLE